MFEECCLICGMKKQYSKWPMCRQDARQYKMSMTGLEKLLLQEHIWCEISITKEFYGKGILEDILILQNQIKELSKMKSEDCRGAGEYEEEAWV